MSTPIGPTNRLPSKSWTLPAAFNAQAFNMPFVGCFSGDGQTFVGSNFGNRPDLLKLNHIRQKVQEYEQRIITMTIGQLDNPLRTAGFVAEIARITADIATLVADLTATAGAVIEEIDAGLAFVQGRINELEQMQSQLQAVPENLRSKIETKLLERYDKYLGDLEAQATNLQTARACFQSLL